VFAKRGVIFVLCVNLQSRKVYFVSGMSVKAISNRQRLCICRRRNIASFSLNNEAQFLTTTNGRVTAGDIIMSSSADRLTPNHFNGECLNATSSMR